MSGRPTPETDDLARGNHVVPTEWAEQLERERDDARTELEEYRSIAENIGAEKAVSEKENAIRERDEAREELRSFKHDKKHLCDSHRDMTGNCMVCRMSEPPKWYNEREIPADIKEETK